MARVFITGSADNLGRAAAHTLLDDGHEVVVHARNHDRLTAVRDLLDRGAAAVVGDLSDLEETRGLARDLNRASSDPVGPEQQINRRCCIWAIRGRLKLGPTVFGSDR